LARSAKNRPPRKTASDVAAVFEIVLVGMSNHVKDTGVAIDVSLHIPLKLKGVVEAPEDEDEELVVVGKGKMPLAGTNTEGDEKGNPVAELDTDPDLIELNAVDLPVTKLRLATVLDADPRVPLAV
jgi:hypothetical protein